jgi:Sigma 54 modulation/S30EA ribosomal protein C terminus
MREAVEHACDRLRIRLGRAARNWEAVRGGRPAAGPGEWRHQSLPAPRLPYFPRPPGERTVVRHKSCTLGRETPDEAAAEAELMDYDFHLFTEKSTGEDSVIYRTADGYRPLAHRRTRQLGPVGPSITVSEMPALRGQHHRAGSSAHDRRITPGNHWSSLPARRPSDPAHPPSWSRP